MTDHTPQDTIPTPLSWQVPAAHESDKAWAAFCRYRDQGGSRSLVRVGQELGKSRVLIERWSAAFDWVERVRAYDAHCAEQARTAAEAEHTARITAYRERAAKIGAATADVSLGFLVAAGQRLKGLTNPKADAESVDDIPIKSLPAFLRAAAAVAEISLRVEAEALGVRELETYLSADDEDAAEDSG